jgi:GTPase SAR1 family protein
VTVYDVTQDGESNNVCSWYEEAMKHCPENAIKILVGNKTDLLDRMNKKSSFNPLDRETWNIIASEKISYYEISCKTYEGIEAFWNIMEENVRIIVKRIVIPENPFKTKSVGKNRSSSCQKRKA